MAKIFFEFQSGFCTVLDTFFGSDLQYNSIKIFSCLDFWKNEFAGKLDQKLVSGLSEFFPKKGSMSYWGGSWNENFWMVSSSPFH